MRILAEVEFDEITGIVQGQPYQIISRNTTAEKVNKLFQQFNQLKEQAKAIAHEKAVNQSVNQVNDEIYKGRFQEIQQMGFMHKSEIEAWFDYKATEIIERERRRVWWNKLINPIKSKFKSALFKLGLAGAKKIINR